MRTSWTNVGYARAVFAGIFGLGTTIWPMSPQAQEFGSATWMVLSIVTALGFIAAVIFADRHTAVAKTILVVGAVVRIVNGIAFGRFAEMGAGALLIDLVPAILALGAAFLIGAIRRRAFP
jgi:hypothetical protein